MMKKIIAVILFCCAFVFGVQHVVASEAMIEANKPGIETQEVSEKVDATLKTDIQEKTSVTNLAEDQIPLSIETASKNASSQGQTGKLVLTLIVLLGMGATAYYFIKKYSFSNKINKSNMQIKILAQHYLGAKKSLAIIRVAGESILVGITDQNISMIKSLSLIDDEIPQTEMTKSFSQTLENNPKEDTIMSKEDISFEEEDFSFAGIKSNVSQKLKSMRNIQ